MSYKSPIEIIYGEMTNKLENEVFTVMQNIGINIDKDELIKALQYDRNQYEKGYADAMMNAVPIRHGVWEDDKVAFYNVCSECGAKVRCSLDQILLSYPLDGFHYCPNCGAKMDGKKVSE